MNIMYSHWSPIAAALALWTAPAPAAESNSAAPPASLNSLPAPEKQPPNRWPLLGAHAVNTPTKARIALQDKLDQIILERIHYYGLPLGEVLKQLTEQIKKQDRQGINFIFSPYSEHGRTTIDPSTGLPVPAEPLDLANVAIHTRLPLENIRLSDLLEVLMKVADAPLTYTVQDYGVVISQSQPASVYEAIAPVLVTQTFLFEKPELLFQGLESAFGIQVPAGAGTGGTAKARGSEEAEAKLKAAEAKMDVLQKRFTENHPDVLATQQSMEALRQELQATQHYRKVRLPSRDEQQRIFRELFNQLDIKLEPPKSVHFNEHTGIVMVRVAHDEMGVVSAAMNTLGGTQLASYPPNASANVRK